MVTHPLSVANIWTPSLPVQLAFPVLIETIPLCAFVLALELLGKPLPERPRASAPFLLLGRWGSLRLSQLRWGRGGELRRSGLWDIDGESRVGRRAGSLRAACAALASEDFPLDFL